MHYRIAHEDIAFEIPDSWWVSAGAQGFVPQGPAFAASSSPEWPTTLVPLVDVEAPRRTPGVIGLDEDRTVSVLRAFRSAAPLPPLEVHQPPEPKRCKFRVRDGYHRYYASVAAGFECLPVSVRPYFDFSAL